ncbi:MAG: type II toxin-antitoxin system VapC family toxin [Actinomycetota bacterium]|nr:type II toxin-antitoxin system VapC family toxin [Actinomycetota bacterium]
MTAVLDASAVIALLRREPGHELVAEHLTDAVMSAVNWSEVLQKVIDRGWPSGAATAVRSLGVEVLPFTPDDADGAAQLWPTTRSAGLSLGDRACLALTARVPGGVAVTADQAWTTLDLDVEVQQIR